MGPDLEKSKVEIGALTRKDNGSVTHNQEDSLVQCMSNYEDNNFHEEVMNDSLAKMSAETEDVEVNIVECTKSGKNVVHVLDIITDLLGTPSAESIARIGNEKARKYLNSMRKKQLVPLSKKIPNADPLALKILERLLAFDPKDRPSAEEALADPYFYDLANKENEPSRQPISKLEFEFERRKLTKDDVRELIYREILEYHPEMLKEYVRGTDHTHFVYPSGVDRFKEQFAHLEECEGRRERNSPHRKHATSLPRERICSTDETDIVVIKRAANSVTRPTVQSPPKSQAAEESQSTEELQSANRNAVAVQASSTKPKCSTRSLLKSDSICASMCIGIVGNDREVHAL